MKLPEHPRIAIRLVFGEDTVMEATDVQLMLIAKYGSPGPAGWTLLQTWYGASWEVRLMPDPPEAERGRDETSD